MTNKEKYKTAEERAEVFDTFCHAHTVCRLCKLRGREHNLNKVLCAYRWLDLNDEPSISDIVAVMRAKAEESKNTCITRMRKILDETIGGYNG